MNLENIFYILGIVCFALFIAASLFIVAVAIKIYRFAKHQAEIIDEKSQKITSLLDIITSPKTKAAVAFLTTAAFLFRIIKKVRSS